MQTCDTRNPRKALELASEATQAVDFKDWWWKARLGKAYYQLGLLRDAEKQFKSSLKDEEMISTHLELCKVYLRLDQPNAALDQYGRAGEKFAGDTHILLGLARTYDMLNALLRGVQFYKRVLQYDSVNAEAIACLASHHFYTDQPEIALRFYRRLLQNGEQSGLRQLPPNMTDASRRLQILTVGHHSPPHCCLCAPRRLHKALRDPARPHRQPHPSYCSCVSVGTLKPGVSAQEGHLGYLRQHQRLRPYDDFSKHGE